MSTKYEIDAHSVIKKQSQMDSFLVPTNYLGYWWPSGLRPSLNYQASYPKSYGPNPKGVGIRVSPKGLKLGPPAPWGSGEQIYMTYKGPAGHTI